jgi:hypothetical protein
LVNTGQHSQQADNADNAIAKRCCEAQIAPMPLEQTNSTSADESEEASAEEWEAKTEVLNRQDVESVGNPVDIQQTELSVGGEGGDPIG